MNHYHKLIPWIGHRKQHQNKIKTDCEKNKFNQCYVYLIPWNYISAHVSRNMKDTEEGINLSFKTEILVPKYYINKIILIKYIISFLQKLTYASHDDACL